MVLAGILLALLFAGGLFLLSPEVLDHSIIRFRAWPGSGRYNEGGITH